jgi:PIN domain nuclease of toxin-antitoxin system
MILDASAIIAWYEDEPGAEIVEQELLRGDGIVSSVNFTEIIGKLVGKGLAPENEVIRDMSALKLEVAPFDQSLAVAASYYYARRKPYGLSLGDCACLALAEVKGLTVMTAERAWAKIPNLRVPVKLIR